MIKEQYKYSDITAKILAVQLEKEMTLHGLNFVREFVIPIFYKNKQIGTRRVDFLVEQTVSVEIKAIITLEDVHLAQAINYLEAYCLEIRKLINFGAKSLQFKRLINPKINQNNQRNQR